MQNRPRLRSRVSFEIFVTVVALGVPAVVACGGRVAGEGGGSGSLGNGTGSGGGTGAAPTSSATGSTGTSPQPSSPPLCDSNGFSTSDGASCSVSFSKSLFPSLISATGSGRCADASCHGHSSPGGTGPNAPTIDGSSAAKAYASLVRYVDVGGEPYVNACSTDPRASAITCNLAGSCSPQMPTSSGGVSGTVDDQQLKDLNTWLGCGAPLN